MMDVPVDAMAVITELETIIGEQAREIAILRVRIKQQPREVVIPPTPPDASRVATE